MNTLISGLTHWMAMAPPPAGGEGTGPPPWTTFVPLILLFAVFYFLLIRPQQKRQREHEQLISAVKKGDQVVTSGGIHGVVANVKENTFTVRIADGVKVEVSKSSITTVTRSGSGGES
jgi:preprotein translocase subunit YajC